MRRFIDISMPIYGGMLSWPTDPKVSITPFKEQASGKASNVSALQLGTHSGTHVDPPIHFLTDGATVDELSMDAMIGPVKVIELNVKEKITRSDLEDQNLKGTERLLLKTRNSNLYSDGDFTENFIYLAKDGAEFLIEQGIKLVGIDYLSIDEFGNSQAPAHHVLLEGGVVIVESINLFSVEPGDFELICLPLRILEGNGGPARAVLIG